METPNWLEPIVEQSPTDPSNALVQLEQLRELQELQSRALESRLALRNIEYTLVFETVLDRTCNGHLLSDILEDDYRNIDTKLFNRWMMSDKERKARFHEAKAIGSCLMEDDMLRIARGILNPEADTDRSKLIVDTMWKLLKVNDRKRYGDDKFASTGSSGSVNIVISGIENPYLPAQSPDLNIIDITP